MKTKPHHLEIASMIDHLAAHAKQCAEHGDLHGAYQFLALVAQRVEQQRDIDHEEYKRSR